MNCWKSSPQTALPRHLDTQVSLSAQVSPWQCAPTECLQRSRCRYVSDHSDELFSPKCIGTVKRRLVPGCRPFLLVLLSRRILPPMKKLACGTVPAVSRLLAPEDCWAFRGPSLQDLCVPHACLHLQTTTLHPLAPITPSPFWEGAQQSLCCGMYCGVLCVEGRRCVSWKTHFSWMGKKKKKRKRN